MWSIPCLEDVLGFQPILLAMSRARNRNAHFKNRKSWYNRSLSFRSVMEMCNSRRTWYTVTAIYYTVWWCWTVMAGEIMQSPFQTSKLPNGWPWRTAWWAHSVDAPGHKFMFTGPYYFPIDMGLHSSLHEKGRFFEFISDEVTNVITDIELFAEEGAVAWCLLVDNLLPLFQATFLGTRHSWLLIRRHILLLATPMMSSCSPL